VTVPEENQHPRHNPWPVWAVVTAGAAATMLLVLVAVLWAGSQYDSHGARLIDPPMATVVAAVMGALGTLIALTLRASGIIRHEVKNSHKTNLRDDVDHITKVLETVAKDVTGMKRDHGRLADRVDDTNRMLAYTNQKLDKVIDHVDDIEDTIIPRKDDKS